LTVSNKQKLYTGSFICQFISLLRVFTNNFESMINSSWVTASWKTKVLTSALFLTKSLFLTKICV
jgi:hypothetical protein